MTAPWGAQLTGAAIVMAAFTHAFQHLGTILDLRALGGFPTHIMG